MEGPATALAWYLVPYKSWKDAQVIIIFTHVSLTDLPANHRHRVTERGWKQAILAHSRWQQQLPLAWFPGGLLAGLMSQSHSTECHVCHVA